MTATDDEKELWAKQGETITCVNGHPICDIAHDIHVGDGRMSLDFTNWRIPEPQTTDSLEAIRCRECRGVWLRVDSNNNVLFHFAEGWR